MSAMENYRQLRIISQGAVIPLKKQVLVQAEPKLPELSRPGGLMLTLDMYYDIRAYVVSTLGCLELLQQKLSRSSNKTVVTKVLGMAARQNKAAVETVEKLFQSLSSTEPLRSVGKARTSLGLKLLHDKQVSRVMTEPSTAFSVCGGRVSIGTAANGKAMLVVNVQATGPKALKRIPEKYCGFPVKVVRR